MLYTLVSIRNMRSSDVSITGAPKRLDLTSLIGQFAKESVRVHVNKICFYADLSISLNVP